VSPVGIAPFFVGRVMKERYIFEHSVMVAVRDHKGQWWKVVRDCVRCGQCCMDTSRTWKFALDDIIGGCRYLEELDDGLYNCELRSYRPFGCCCNNPHTIPEYCSVVLEKITEEEAIEVLLRAA